MVILNVTTHQDPSLMTGNYKIFPYVYPSSNAVVEIRPNWGYVNNVIKYSGSQIWMGSEPFAAGIAPKNCFSVVAPGPPPMAFTNFSPFYQYGTTMTNKVTGELCLTTAKGVHSYKSCSGSCATGTDMDPGVRLVSLGKNTAGGGNTKLLDWDLIPVSWVPNGYYIRSRGSDARFSGLLTSGIKWDAVDMGNAGNSKCPGWKPPKLRVQPYLKWGAYIGSYSDSGSVSDEQDLSNFIGAFVSGVVAGVTAGFVNLDLVDEKTRRDVYFTSFPPQFQTRAYPFACLYEDLQTLPSQKQGGSKYDDKEYIFVIEPV